MLRKFCEKPLIFELKVLMKTAMSRPKSRGCGYLKGALWPGWRAFFCE